MANGQAMAVMNLVVPIPSIERVANRQFLYCHSEQTLLREHRERLAMAVMNLVVPIPSIERVANRQFLYCHSEQTLLREHRERSSNGSDESGGSCTRHFAFSLWPIASG
jgi:hypothetical protein